MKTTQKLMRKNTHRMPTTRRPGLERLDQRVVFAANPMADAALADPPPIAPPLRTILAAGSNLYAYGTLKYGMNAPSEVIPSQSSDLTGNIPTQLGNLNSGLARRVLTGGWGVAATPTPAPTSDFAYGTLKYGVNGLSGNIPTQLGQLSAAQVDAVFGPQVRGWNASEGLQRDASTYARQVDRVLAETERGSFFDVFVLHPDERRLSGNDGPMPQANAGRQALPVAHTTAELTPRQSDVMTLGGHVKVFDGADSFFDVFVEEPRGNTATGTSYRRDPMPSFCFYSHPSFELPTATTNLTPRQSHVDGL